MRRLVSLFLSVVLLTLVVLPSAANAQEGGQQSVTTEYQIYIDPNAKDGQSNILLETTPDAVSPDSQNSVAKDVYDSNLIAPAAIDHAGKLTLTCTEVAGRMYCNWNITLDAKYQIQKVNLTMFFQKSDFGKWSIIGRTPVKPSGYMTNFQGGQESFKIADWKEGYYRARMEGNIITIQSGVALMTPLNSNTVPYLVD